LQRLRPSLSSTSTKQKHHLQLSHGKKCKHNNDTMSTAAVVKIGDQSGGNHGNNRSGNSNSNHNKKMIDNIPLSLLRSPDKGIGKRPGVQASAAQQSHSHHANAHAPPRSSQLAPPRDKRRDSGYAHAQSAGLLWQTIVGEHVRFPKHWFEDGQRVPLMGSLPRQPAAGEDGSGSPPLPLPSPSSSSSHHKEWMYIAKHRIQGNPTLSKIVRPRLGRNSHTTSNRIKCNGRLLLHFIIQDQQTWTPLVDLVIGCFHPKYAHGNGNGRSTTTGHGNGNGNASADATPKKSNVSAKKETEAPKPSSTQCIDHNGQQMKISIHAHDEDHNNTNDNDNNNDEEEEEEDAQHTNTTKEDTGNDNDEIDENVRDLWMAVRVRRTHLKKTHTLIDPLLVPSSSLLSVNQDGGANHQQQKTTSFADIAKASPFGNSKRSITNDNVAAVFGEKPPIRTLHITESRLYEKILTAKEESAQICYKNSQDSQSHSTSSASPAILLVQEFLFKSPETHC
jgi:hypothetical protein